MALGFASVENVGYLLGAAFAGELTTVFCLRFLLSVPGHVLFSAIFGYALGMTRCAHPPRKRKALSVLAGLALAVGAHAAFNGLASLNPYWNLVLLFDPGLRVLDRPASHHSVGARGLAPRMELLTPVVGPRRGRRETEHRKPHFEPSGKDIAMTAASAPRSRAVNPADRRNNPNPLAGMIRILAVILIAGTVFAASAPRPLGDEATSAPVPGGHTLFSLGGQGREHRRVPPSAPGDYRHYPLTFPEGRGLRGGRLPIRPWTGPYVQPGPVDAWAGSRQHTFTILFHLDAVASEGDCLLEVDLVDNAEPVRAPGAGGREREVLRSRGTATGRFGPLHRGRPVEGHTPRDSR